MGGAAHHCHRRLRVQCLSQSGCDSDGAAVDPLTPGHAYDGGVSEAEVLPLTFAAAPQPRGDLGEIGALMAQLRRAATEGERVAYVAATPAGVAFAKLSGSERPESPPGWPLARSCRAWPYHHLPGDIARRTGI